MALQFAAVLVFFLVGAAFVFGNLLLGFFIRPSRTRREKVTVYECGEPTIGPAWIRFNSRFYTIALVYLLFDVEVVVLVPALLVLRELKVSGGAAAATVALLAFIVLLVLGLAYEWFYGNLDWIKPEVEAELGEAGQTTQQAPASPAEKISA